MNALPEAERDLFRGVGARVQYPKGHIIFAAGEEADRVFLIEDGLVKIYRLMEDGSRATVALRYAGELIGLAEALYGGRRRCYAEAMCRVELVMVPTRIFRGLLLEHASLAVRVAEILGARLREAHDTIHELACRYVPGRLAVLLLKLAERCGVREEDGIKIDVALTHEEIACMIGTSRPTVTAVLNSFRQEGSITCQGKYLKITDGAKLARWV